MSVDECYSTVDRALKYTLVHLKTKQRDTALHKFMTYCSQKHGIVQQEIFGYSSVSASSQSNGLFDHPAFRVLVLHKAESRPCFSWWIESPGLRGGGILATYARRGPALPIQAGAAGSNKTEQNKEIVETDPSPVETEGESVAQVSNTTICKAAANNTDSFCPQALLKEENEQLKSNNQALAAKNQALETDLFAATDAITALELKITQLEASPSTSTTTNTTPTLEETLAKNRTLTAEAEAAKHDFRELRKTALLIEKDRDRLQAALDKELENPSAPPGTFKRLVGVAKFAETASTANSDWDHGELRRLVFDLVQTMMPKQASRAELDRKVQEINGPLFNLCSKAIDDRGVRKRQGELLQQGLPGPAPAAKKRKSGGGGGGGGGGSGKGVEGVGESDFGYGFF